MVFEMKINFFPFSLPRRDWNEATKIFWAGQAIGKDISVRNRSEKKSRNFIRFSSDIVSSRKTRVFEFRSENRKLIGFKRFFIKDLMTRLFLIGKKNKPSCIRSIFFFAKWRQIFFYLRWDQTEADLVSIDFRVKLIKSNSTLENGP